MVSEQLPELKRLSQLEAPGLTPKLKCLAQKLVQLFTDDASTAGKRSVALNHTNGPHLEAVMNTVLYVSSWNF